MPFRFENLDVWIQARAFVNVIYRTTRSFPKDELFGLVSQLRRAALSITSNIAEGSDRKSDVEFRRYLRISLTSINETISCFYIALDQEFINKQQFTEIYEEANRLAARLNALISALNSKAVVSKQ
ncbi:MAG: four helix bundle protein [Candidatus Uhrbacteria bacterium]